MRAVHDSGERTYMSALFTEEEPLRRGATGGLSIEAMLAAFIVPIPKQLTGMLFCLLAVDHYYQLNSVVQFVYGPSVVPEVMTSNAQLSQHNQVQRRLARYLETHACAG